MNLREELFKNQDIGYREFHRRLLPGYTAREIIGVRLPVLRKLAKQALKENAENRCEYYEEVMVYGLTLGLKKGSAAEHMEDLRPFVPLIDNWAVCDSCCSGFKFTAKYRAEMYDFICSYLGKSEFEYRFAIVMLMDYYLTDDYIDRVLPILAEVRSDAYYVNMAAAWAAAEAYIRFPEKTKPFFEEKRFSAEVQNKGIQKIRDSFRVSKEKKASLGKLKIQG